MRRGRAEAATPLLRDSFPDVDALVDALRMRAATIAAGESCTGGLFIAALTAVPGASAVVRGGVVAYADDVKAAMLDVPPALIATHGAVSAEVALAMARGALQRFGATFGVGITGVAGPEGGTAAKPVGTIYVGLVARDVERSVRLDGDSGRAQNRAAAVLAALELVLEQLSGDQAPG